MTLGVLGDRKIDWMARLNGEAEWKIRRIQFLHRIGLLLSWQHNNGAEVSTVGRQTY